MTSAIQKANELIGADQVKQLMDAGICLTWTTEFDFLLWAVNVKEHDKTTYKALDELKKAQN